MKCIELFAGAGGAALGLEAAGIEHAALCEWDPDACATMRAAGLGPVVEGDVRDLDAIEAVAGLSCDLLWSSFPCQAWSTAGRRRGAQDERNGWPWTVDAIDRFRPRWFLGENVRGLLCHSSTGCGDPQTCARCYFDGVILPQLRKRFAHVGWWLLDAADYGVPQHRRRVILWAGPAPLQAPERTHASPAECRQAGLFGPRLRPWVSMGEALGLDGGRGGSGLKGSEWTVDRPSPTVRDGNGTSGIYIVAAGETDEGRPRPMDQAAPTIGTKGTAYLLRPAPTVAAGHGGKGCGQVSASAVLRSRLEPELMAATGRRRLTVAECARLQGFPPEHPWQGTKTAQYRAMGNAVPPKLSEVVARRVVEADETIA